MTTGRINQVTAEAWSRRAAALAVTRGLDKCFLGGATMRPRTGFALVRITALRRRQDPPANVSSLGWGPADRRLRCTSTFAESVRKRTHNSARRASVGSPCYRCGWLAREIRMQCEGCGNTTIDSYDPNVSRVGLM